MATTTIELKGRPIWAVFDREAKTLAVHLDLEIPDVPAFANQRRHATALHKLSGDVLARWEELYQRHPDLVGCFFAQDRYELNGYGSNTGGTVWMVLCPLGVHTEDLPAWRGRPVMIDGVLYRIRGVDKHAIGGNPLWERMPIGLLVGPLLDWQFPGAKPPEAQPPKVSVYKAEPSGDVDPDAGWKVREIVFEPAPEGEA